MSNNKQEDFDDLDDILENALNEFDEAPKTPSSEKKTSASSPVASSSADASSSSNLEPNDIDLDDILQKTFTPQEKEVVNHLTEQVTKFFNELEQTEGGEKSSNFQNALHNTLNLLNQNVESMNDTTNTSNTGSSSGGDNSGEEEPVDEGAFSNLLQSMMEVLMSPDILRQPMEELREKYPIWLDQNRGKVADEEYQRIQKQYDLCCKICNVYETSKYPDAIDELIELMKAMQEQGQPPEEIVSQLSKAEGGSEEESQVQKLLQGLKFTDAAGGAGGKGGCPTQ
ncbi:predicted protein [Naegleria gruberi]|uniref:Predicted protein n=1 Tax=Naegleria gruberi TaxID=5762 RepID=D2W353_NAEGR|nr:Peroxin 19 (Pex19), putative [Naegleria gruberi]EFC36519.1 predicted protein [Naegleria gruberi]|eukprot:XP_002669263.1 predicted protein [Naegleria gruberi strain NEG-M]